MMEEIWKDIEGYEGHYQVSNLGRVRSLDRIIICSSKFGKAFERKVKGRILSPGIDTKGYYFVNLKKGGITLEARNHRLVAAAFVDGCFDGAVVNHKDENKQNNVCSNLEWVTFADNLNYGTARQRSTEGHGNSIPIELTDCNGNILAEYPSIEETARQIGFSPCRVKQCCEGYPKTKTSKGHYLRYKK